METYQQMKQRHKEEIESLPVQWAFNDEQFAEGMRKFGLNPEDKDKVCSVGYGGFVKREDQHLLPELAKRQIEELQRNLNADT